MVYSDCIYYTDIPVFRQKEILKKGKRRIIRRKYLSDWECQKLDDFANVVKRGKIPTEQQFFYLRGIEDKLVCLKKIKPRT